MDPFPGCILGYVNVQRTKRSVPCFQKTRLMIFAKQTLSFALKIFSI